MILLPITYTQRLLNAFHPGRIKLGLCKCGNRKQSVTAKFLTSRILWVFLINVFSLKIQSTSNNSNLQGKLKNL